MGSFNCSLLSVAIAGHLSGARAACAARLWVGLRDEDIASISTADDLFGQWVFVVALTLDLRVHSLFALALDDRVNWLVVSISDDRVLGLAVRRDIIFCAGGNGEREKGSCDKNGRDETI